MTSATAEDRPLVAEHRSRTREVASLLLRNKLAVAALVFLVLLVIAAIFGDALAPYDPTAASVPDRLQPPSTAHWFGTDELGRDVFSRVLVAASVSLQVGFIAVGIALSAGVVFGLVAGFYGGKVDDVIMRFMDMVFAFPAILLALAIIAILGPGVTNAMIAIGIVFTPIFARVTRSRVLSVREEVYVRAARSVGADDRRLLVTHVLPNALAPIIVQGSVSLAFAILQEAALSFLGLGTRPPEPSWGRMLAEGRGFIQQAWWMAVFPGLAILFTVMSFNFLGDGLRDALDPRRAKALEAQGGKG